MSPEGESSRDQPESLRDIARWLTTPARCGVYLSVLDIQRIGQQAGIHGLPPNRRFAIEQLFRAAAIEGVLDSLFDALIAEIEEHRTAYRDCGAPALDHWDALAGETVAILTGMQRASQTSS